MNRIELAIVGLLACPLALSSTACASRYIKNAKMAEARNNVGVMLRDAAAAYELSETGTLGAQAAPKVKRRLCPSASKTVPASAAAIKGTKYQSTPEEWDADKATNAGFSCLRFKIDTPQYYMYGYKASSDTVTATANGDLDGDGKLSTFEGTAKVNAAEVLVVNQVLRQTDSEE